MVKDECSAIRWAMGTPTGRKVRIVASGCYYMHQIKTRWTPEQRKELFAPLAEQLRAKYDGEHYLYESEEGQEEVRRIFGLYGIVAANFPVGLVPKSTQP